MIGGGSGVEHLPCEWEVVGLILKRLAISILGLVWLFSPLKPHSKNEMNYIWNEW